MKTKKSVKKTAKKTSVKKSKKQVSKKANGKKTTKQRSKKSVKKPAAKKGLLGVVTHFYGGIEVAIVKLAKPLGVGANVYFKGATTDFTQTVESMQYDHVDIPAGKKGQEVGMKVTDKVREGDEMYEAAE